MRTNKEPPSVYNTLPTKVTRKEFNRRILPHLWSSVYRHHNRWSKNGSYKKIFDGSLDKPNFRNTKNQKLIEARPRAFNA